ncbi:anthrone oxygenase family protein [Streptomyces sp. NPDC086835]|uniref:anthrone oxygenase family protein n=1 Tax=Streptomyces sp. NPDC086835 TaxID=3365761 RepID=UPI00382E612E
MDRHASRPDLVACRVAESGDRGHRPGGRWCGIGLARRLALLDQPGHAGRDGLVPSLVGAGAGAPELEEYRVAFEQPPADVLEPQQRVQGGTAVLFCLVHGGHGLVRDPVGDNVQQRVTGAEVRVRGLGAGLLAVVSFLVTRLGNVPINGRIKQWAATSAPADHAEILARWEVFNYARTGAAFAAFGLLIVLSMRFSAHERRTLADVDTPLPVPPRG